MKNTKLFSFLALLLFVFGFAVIFVIWKNKSVLVKEKAETSSVVDMKTIEVFPVRVYFFASNTCPHCRDEQKFLDTLKTQLPFLEVERFEISKDSTSAVRRVFSNISKENGTGGSIPLTIIGESAVLGFDSADSMGVEFKEMIKSCALNLCQSELDRESDLVEEFDYSKMKISLDEFEDALGADK